MIFLAVVQQLAGLSFFILPLPFSFDDGLKGIALPSCAERDRVTFHQHLNEALVLPLVPTTLV